MNRPEHQVERRSAPRRPTPSDRIAWSHPATDHFHTGWLANMSRTGLAFVTATRDEPQTGEAIELTLRARTPAPLRRRVRVAHTVPFDRYFSVVGCVDEATDSPPLSDCGLALSEPRP